MAVTEQQTPGRSDEIIAIVTRLYERLFSYRPGTRTLVGGTAPDQAEWLASMIDVLGGLDESIVDGWTIASAFLANIFIPIETRMVAQ